VLHKYTIHETVHCVAVTDSEAITRGDKWPTAGLAVRFKHIAGEDVEIPRRNAERMW